MPEKYVFIRDSIEEKVEVYKVPEELFNRLSEVFSFEEVDETVQQVREGGEVILKVAMKDTYFILYGDTE